MKFSKRQRERMPLCYDRDNPKRWKHAWKKGTEKFGEAGVCAVCGYDAFNDVRRSVMHNG